MSMIIALILSLKYTFTFENNPSVSQTFSPSNVPFLISVIWHIVGPNRCHTESARSCSGPWLTSHDTAWHHWSLVIVLSPFAHMALL